MPSFVSRIKHAFFNSFSAEEERPVNYTVGPSYSSRPDRPRGRMNSERTIISSIYTRMAIDVSAPRIEHVRTDANGQYLETINSGLNKCLNIRANLDQFGRHFRTDMPLSLFNWGTIGIIPVDTTIDPKKSGSYDIKSLRVGEILQWYPEHVQLRAYNQKTGQKEDIILPKTMVAIVENPFYGVMNEPNSTLQRLIHKLGLLDHVDEVSSSGKLDIIIQLPFTVKSESRKTQAENRIKDLETQLKGSTYGVAYADATEKITQLNRAVENNLLEQVKYLKEELYNELGLTPEIMNGTADDVAMLNYINRTIEPILDAIVEAMAGTFLTDTARTQNQSIMYFQNPFKLIPISELAQIADVLSRNQIVSPNEIRPALGLKPRPEPQADKLVNSNMPLDQQITGEEGDSQDPADAEEAKLDEMMQELDL